MLDPLILMIHLFVTCTKLLRSGGVRAVGRGGLRRDHQGGTPEQAGETPRILPMRLKLSTLALEDFALIHDYTLTEWGEAQAVR